MGKIDSWRVLPLFAVMIATQSSSAQSVRRAKAEITVGSTVQVSKSFSDVPHWENLAAGDPLNPGHLITCSMVRAHVAEKSHYQYCYVSFDDGKTWEPTLKITEGTSNGDPAVAYGRGNDVYVVSLIEMGQGRGLGPASLTAVFKSTDGGRTWGPPARFPFIDRENISVDTTGGRYDGRIYVVGKYFVPGISASVHGHSVQMFRSLDGGKTFLGPVHAQVPQGSSPDVLGQVILSDGTVVVLFNLPKWPRPAEGPDEELRVIASKDGGETLGESVKVLDRQSPVSRGDFAVDPGSKWFKDRLYVVFGQKIGQRTQIQLSYSTDNGKTWSKPIVVNDDRSPDKPGHDHMLPTVSVNKIGIVLVTWYDRRKSTDNIGWEMRGAASLDGGETFSASVLLSDKNNLNTDTMTWDVLGRDRGGETTPRSVVIGIDWFFPGGGHTTGAAVGADGTFYPVWIDNRNGPPQVWTAPVRVTGPVIPHGVDDLKGLDDISKFVEFEFSKQSFDRRNGTLTISAQLKNVSKSVLRGPLKIRVLSLESPIGVAEITNSDDGQNGTGAVWDFSSALSEGALAPMQLSRPKTLTFHIGDISQLRATGKAESRWLVVLDALVLGQLQPENRSKN